MTALFQLIAIFFASVAILRTIKWTLALSLGVAVYSLYDRVVQEVTDYLNGLSSTSVGGIEVPIVDMMAYMGVLDGIGVLLGAYGVLLGVRWSGRFLDWMMS